MGDGALPNTRIMLSNCKQTAAMVENLCRQFGEMNKQVHFPKFGNNTCFVEFKSSENAQQAISAINANTSLGMKASLATNRDTANNTRQQGPPNNTNGGHKKPQRSRDQSRDQSRGRGHKKAPYTPRQKINLVVDNAHCSRNVSTLPNPVAPVPVVQPNSTIIGPCVKCEAPSDSQCEICFDTYCSVECQRLDWGRHKKECRPPPALIKNKNAVTPTAAPQPRPVNANPVPFLPLPTPPTQAQPLMPIKIAPYVGNSLRSNVSKPDPKHAPLPKPGDLVVITSAPFPNTVYLQAIDKKTCQELNDVLGKVANYAVHAPQLTSLPKINQFVLAERDGSYQRALVLSTLPDRKSVKVAFIDSGHNTVTECHNLKALDDFELICAVRHNFRAFLKGVPQKLKSKEVDELMQGVINRFEEFELHFDGAALDVFGSRLVELVRFQDQTLLNAEILRLCGKKPTNRGSQPVVSEPQPSTSTSAAVAPPVVQAKPSDVSHKTSQSAAEVVTVVKAGTESANVSNGNATNKGENFSDDYIYGNKDLVINGVPNGRNLRIFILDNDMLYFGKVAGIFYNHKALLPAIQTSVKKYCAGSTECYRPRKFELCLAKCDGDWYRGMSIMDPAPDDNFYIFFIDYGNFSEVGVADIRRINSELVKLPVYTRMCSIKGLPQDCSSILDQLQEMFAVGDDIIAESVFNVIKDSEDINDSYAEVTIKNLEQKLNL